MRRRRRTAVLVVCSLSLLITYLDSTAVNVALPAIQTDFHCGLSGLQWVLDAYLVVLGSLLVLCGSIGDRVGRRRVFLSGLAVFAAASLGCGLSHNIASLITARAIQGAGGCMITPVSLSIVRHQYPNPVERARAFGIWSATFGVGIAAGPIVGGLLVSTVGWHAIFFANLPIAAIVGALAVRFVPESRSAEPHSLDIQGQISIAAALGCLTSAVIEGGTLGWNSWWILGLLACSAVSFGMFVWVELRSLDPLVDLRLLRQRGVSASNAIAFLSFIDLSGFLLLNSVYLQDVKLYPAATVGIVLLPATVPMAVIAPFSGRLVGRVGPRLPLIVAAGALSVGCGLLTQIGVGGPPALLVAGYLAIGVAFGMVNAPLTQLTLSGIPVDGAGFGSALIASSRQIGNLMGVALMGAVIAGSAAVHGEVLRRIDLVQSIRSAWWVGSALALCCGLLVLLFIDKGRTAYSAEGLEEAVAA
jgi:EmrB/QacA subfamily drug resistance transporter